MGVLFVIVIFLLKFILYALLSLLGVILLLLLLPFSYTGFLKFDMKDIDEQEGVREEFGRVKVGWPWSVFSFEMELGGPGDSYFYFLGRRIFRLKKSEKPKKEKKEKKKAEKADEPVGEETKKENIFTFAYIRELIDLGILRDLFEFLEKLLKWILPKEIKVHTRIGLEDPSYTGYLYGAYSSVPALRTRWNIYIEPNFAEEDFEIDGAISGRAQLFILLILIIKLRFKESVRKIMKDRRRRKKDGKQKSSK